MPITSVKVSLKLPIIGSLDGTWEPNEKERNAAWEMYVELVTRVAVMPLDPEEGLLREALSSLHSLFETTRKILREHAPTIAQPKNNGKYSFGYLAVAVLNTAIRPVLSKWHPLLLSYEFRKPASTSSADWEAQWESGQDLREMLASTRLVLVAYANLLAKVNRL